MLTYGPWSTPYTAPAPGDNSGNTAPGAEHTQLNTSGRVGQRLGAGGGEGVGGGAVSGQPGALWQTEGRWWQQLSPQRRPGPPQLPPAARGGAGAAHIRPGRGGAASPSCSSQDTLEPGPGTHPALLPSSTTTSPGTKVVVVVRLGPCCPT